MPGLFVKLEVEWVDHPKIIEAGIDGAGLHGVALCLAKRSNTDGWLHRALLVRYGATDELLERLVGLRLLEVDEDRRYRPWGWHRRNPSQGAIDATRTAKAEAAKAGNHKRWGHPGDVAACATCNSSAQVTRISDRTGSQAVAEPSPDTESETDTDPSSSQSDFTTGAAHADEEEGPQQQTPEELPDPTSRLERARAICDRIGGANHDRRRAAGTVNNPTAHRRACVDAAIRDHLEAAQQILHDHPNWTDRQVADELTRPPVQQTTVPLEESRHPSVLAQQQHDAETDHEPPAASDVAHSAAERARRLLAEARRPDPEEHPETPKDAA